MTDKEIILYLCSTLDDSTKSKLAIKYYLQDTYEQFDGYLLGLVKGYITL